MDLDMVKESLQNLMAPLIKELSHMISVKDKVKQRLVTARNMLEISEKDLSADEVSWPMQTAKYIIKDGETVHVLNKYYRYKLRT